MDGIVSHVVIALCQPLILHVGLALFEILLIFHDLHFFECNTHSSETSNILTEMNQLPTTAVDVDRLDDLLQLAGGGSQNCQNSRNATRPEDPISYRNQYVEQYTKLNQQIDQLGEQIAEIKDCTSQYSQSAQDSVRTKIATKLGLNVSYCQDLISRSKQELDQIKAENAKLGQASAALYQHYKSKLCRWVHQYQQAWAEFKQVVQKTEHRTLSLLAPQLTEEQLNKIIESGQIRTVIQQSLLSETLQETVHHLEFRHFTILELERQVLELHELFKDLATLVDLEQESLNVIEVHIGKADNYVQRGADNLTDAQSYQKSARSRRCCLVFVLLAILVVILFPILVSLRTI